MLHKKNAFYQTIHFTTEPTYSIITIISFNLHNLNIITKFPAPAQLEFYIKIKKSKFIIIYKLPNLNRFQPFHCYYYSVTPRPPALISANTVAIWASLLVNCSSVGASRSSTIHCHLPKNWRFWDHTCTKSTFFKNHKKCRKPSNGHWPRM